MTLVIDNDWVASSSPSLSFGRTSIVVSCPDIAVAVSSLATGALLITSIVTVAVTVSVPSVASKLKESSALCPAFGV